MIHHQMRQILLRLEMVSNGSTQAWNASGGHTGEPDDRIIALVLRHDDPPHLHWRRQYDHARSDTRRRQILTAASAELESLTRRTAPQIACKTDTELILEDHEGELPEVVAARFNVAAGYVRRLRLRDGRGSEDGLKASELIADRSELRERARELRSRGLTTRQIAMTLRVAQTQVMRWTRSQPV